MISRTPRAATGESFLSSDFISTGSLACFFKILLERPVRAGPPGHLPGPADPATDNMGRSRSRSRERKREKRPADEVASIRDYDREYAERRWA